MSGYTDTYAGQTATQDNNRGDNVVSFRRAAPKQNNIYFSKSELNALLALYGSRVTDGQWSDYAIETRNEIVAFSVFKNAYDAPDYTIAKCAKPLMGGEGKFLLLSGARKIAQSDDLNEVLEAIELPEHAGRPKMRIVK